MIGNPRLNQETLFRQANTLALITIIYNLVEGGASIYFGLDDDTLSLFGFGLDSFVEVISGVGIWHMIRRQRQNQDQCPDRFEKTALRVTGLAFYLLTAGLFLTALINLYRGHHPETTVWGIVISLISLAFMWLLIRYKLRVGNAMNSQAILADARCSRVCMILSLALLFASIGYEVTGMGGLDAVGALAIAWFSFREGREAFEKAEGLACSCSCGEKASDPPGLKTISPPEPPRRPPA